MTRRIVTAREMVQQIEALSQPAAMQRTAAPRRQRFEAIPSKGLDALGISQRKLNGNFNSWMDTLSDQDKAEGDLWYPTGNDFGHHKSEEHGVHSDKMFGAMSKLSPQRKWYDNLDDADNIAGNFGHNPGAIRRPAGISGGDNLKQAMRVMGAEDHPDAIEAAFLGGKRIQDIPKTYDFKTNLADPERGGAHNHAAQPGTVDSWMGRTMLWSKKAWDEHQAGGRQLTWHGKGTGEGLDKGTQIKKVNPATGKYEVVGIKPATPKDVAARVTKLAGGYDRMRQAMQQGAARHDMPFTHGAQAAVWAKISKNLSPNHPDFPHHKMGANGQLWNQMWNQRASGLVTPDQGEGPGGLHIPASRLAAHGSMMDDPDGPEDHNPLEGWGGPEDVQAIMQHIQSKPPGWDHFEDRPGLVSLGPGSPAAQPQRPQRPRQQPQDLRPDHLAAYTAMHTAGGGHDNPWEGEAAQDLRQDCAHCGAMGGDEHDVRCPVLQSDSPRDHRMDTKAMGGPGNHYEVPEASQPIHRMNHRAAARARVLARRRVAAGEPADDSDESWDQHIKQRLKDQGGHTFRDHPSEDGPSSGFQVSQTPDNMHPADSFHGRDVKKYKKTQQDLLDSDDSLGVGIWGQPEGVYNEISKNHPDFWDAAKDAYDRDQIAFHNNSTHDDIQTQETNYNGTPGHWMARRHER